MGSKSRTAVSATLPSFLAHSRTGTSASATRSKTYEVVTRTGPSGKRPVSHGKPGRFNSKSGDLEAPKDEYVIEEAPGSSTDYCALSVLALLLVATLVLLLVKWYVPPTFIVAEETQTAAANTVADAAKRAVEEVAKRL